jgi:hypothetical protein
MFSLFSDISRLCCYVRQLKNVMQKINMRTIYPKAFSPMLVRTSIEKGIIMLYYSVTAGPVVDKDVVARKLSVTVNGSVVSERSYSSDTTAFDEVVVAQDDKVVLTLVDVDDAGNVSEPAVAEFVGNDTVPPVKPGEFGVQLVRED